MPTKTSKIVSRRLLLAACVALLVFAFAACSSSGSSKSGSSSGATPDITIANTAFPASTTVKAGATVTVKNNDAFTHTVTSDDGTSFNISIDGGKTATFTAPSTAGSYKFHCNIHSTMKGTLTVQ